MNAASDTSIDKQRLQPLERLGAGSQGVVFRTGRIRIDHTRSAVYKEYKPTVLPKADDRVLGEMIAFLGKIGEADAQRVLEMAAWPVQLVRDDGAFSGFVMPEVQDRFWITMKLASGAERTVVAQAQHLLNSNEFLVARGLVVDAETKLALLTSVAENIGFLHSKNVTVGDLSPKNLLFSLAPSPVTFFVDCDAMAIGGRSVLPQLETPDWALPGETREPRGTKETDRYKMALLTLRVLAGDQCTMDVRGLPAWAYSSLSPLVEAGLSTRPADRPTASDWVAALKLTSAAARRAAQTRFPPPRRPPTVPWPGVAVPVQPSPPPAARPTRQVHPGWTPPAAGAPTQGASPHPVPTPTPTRSAASGGTPPPPRAAAPATGRSRTATVVIALLLAVLLGGAMLTGALPAAWTSWTTPDDSPRWVVLLASFPAADRAAADRSRAQARSSGFADAEVLSSDEWGALLPGYWVVYSPGPYADGPTAARACAASGRASPENCLGRYLSHDARDRPRRCYVVDGRLVEACELR